MNIDKLFSKLLLLSIPLYFTQGWVFGSGSLVSQVLVGIWLLTNFYYLVYYFQKCEISSIAKVILVFWIVNLFYWIVSPKEVHSLGLSFNTFGDFKNLTTVVLSYFPFAVLSRIKIINDNYMRHFAILFLGAAIIAFMTKQGVNMAVFGFLITNNTAYYFAVVLPLLGVFWGDKKFWIGFIVILVFLLLCAKRGAIFCAALTLLVYFPLSMKRISTNKVLSRIIGSVVILAVLAIVVINIFSSSELLQARLVDTQEGNSSARDLIYGELWSIFTQSDFIIQIFGHGMSQTVPLIGSYAHNDWLELLTNEGVVGVILYASVFITMFNYYRKNKKRMEVRYAFMFLVAFLCLLFRSSFSMGYMAPESALFCMAMGYVQNVNNGLIKQ